MTGGLIPQPPRAAVGPCPVCLGPGGSFMHVEGRDYGRCDTCGARYVARADLPSRDVEAAQYALHRNEVDDPGYRRFLARLAGPLMARLGPASRGLDYGCGPGPALAVMLRAAGHEVALYDPFFAPDPAPLAGSYDFVTCTEVAEHFHAPAAEFDRLAGLLAPGGWLAVMTCFQTDDARFAKWQYRRDPTHVVFYREETLHHIARERGLQCEVTCKDVALMRRVAG